MVLYFVVLFELLYCAARTPLRRHLLYKDVSAQISDISTPPSPLFFMDMTDRPLTCRNMKFPQARSEVH